MADFGCLRYSKGSLKMEDGVTFAENPIRKGDLTGSTRDRTAPIRQSVGSGGLFAVRKDWFEEIGYYDTEMHGWGHENIENALRVWRCGGSIHMVPCSTMAHIYRDQNPNVLKPSEFKTLERNLRRLVEAWFEEYKLIPFAKAHKSPVDFGGLSNVRYEQMRLNCKSMKWYMDNIQPCSEIKHPSADLLKPTSTKRACENSQQVSDLGKFDSAQDCAAYISAHPSKCSSGFFMISSFKDWGCRCCANGMGNKEHDGWNIYHIDAEMRNLTKEEKEAQRLIRPERNDGECEVVQWSWLT